MTVQGTSSLRKDQGFLDWGTIICEFLPKEDRDRLALTCSVARTVFQLSLADYYKRFLHAPATPLPASLTDSQWLTRVRKGHAADSGRVALPLHILTGHTRTLYCLEMSLDGLKLCSGSYDNTIKVWNVTTGALLHTLTGHTDTVSCLQMNPDGTRLCSGSWDNTIKVWDVTTGALLHTLTGHTGYVSCLQMSPDGLKLFSGSWDGTIKVWDVTTGALLHILTGHMHWIQCLQMSSDGLKLFSGSRDDTIKVWDLTTGALLHTLTGHSNTVFRLEMSPDGTRLFSGSDDRTIKVWDVTTGALLHTLRGHTHVVSCLQMSPDGLKLFSGSDDKTIRVWDLKTGALLHTLIGHTNSVSCLQMSPDGTRLFSGSWDHSIKVWNVTTGALLHTLAGHANWVNSLQMSPDGLKLFSGSFDNMIKVWDLAAVPEQRISAVSKGGTISLEALGHLPQFVQHRLFYLLYLIHQQQGKLPATTPPNYGELAFYNKPGYAATDEERRLSLDLYSARFFLHHVIDTFTELTTDDLTDEKRAALVKEASERFEGFSASIKDTTNVLYEELILKKETGSTYENRIEALSGVYTQLLGKAGLKKVSFNN